MVGELHILKLVDCELIEISRRVTLRKIKPSFILVGMGFRDFAGQLSRGACGRAGNEPGHGDARFARRDSRPLWGLHTFVFHLSDLN